MTIESRDLFELCKEVYERFPEWETSDWYDLDPDGIPEEYLCTTEDKIDENDYIPNYTSDYLLEKLPNGTTILKDVQGFKAWNVYNRKRIATYTCDSPVEALLKLTLKLHEEGLL